eukprot:jgi/Mesvir1/10578/Mv21793-RA.2
MATDSTPESSVSPADRAGMSSEKGIVEFLHGKTLILTGATGFLGKVLVEKILREQPDVAHIYLVIKARPNRSVHERLLEQVVSAPVFDRLRERYGEGYQAFMLSKLTAIDGDIGQEWLGVDEATREALFPKVDVLVNSAATTAFDERFDTALAINSLGPRNLARFAHRCPKLKLLMHVSTAFVNGLREGRAPEAAWTPGASVAAEQNKLAAGTPPLDVEQELAIASEALATATAEAASRGLDKADANAYVQQAMVALGMARSRVYGWQDTYVFTKAMGEAVLAAERGHLPVAIIRPSIVESAMREPVKGWIEGIRMADPIFIAYGKGQMKGFLADRDGVLDMVPVDIVINAMLAAMPARAGRDGLQVYHVATSTANPLRISFLAEVVSRHFEEAPFKDNKGSAIKLRDLVVFPSYQSFFLDNWIRYKVPLMVLSLLPFLTDSATKRRLTVLEKTFDQLGYFANIYQPYTFYRGRFDASNTRALYEGLREDEVERFNFDLTRIDWRSYIKDVHLPGLRHFVLKGRGS